MHRNHEGQSNQFPTLLTNCCIAMGDIALFWWHICLKIWLR